jgi:hypothetical protein
MYRIVDVWLGKDMALEFRTPSVLGLSIPT